jgi:glucose/arabinose dehydrogenase
MFKVVSLAIMICSSLLMWMGCISQPATLPSQPQETDISSSIDVSVLVEGLDTPWAIDFAPDGRIFVTERPGHIRIVQEGRLQIQPWFTLDAIESGESGLLGVALDPEFAQNGFVYVAYTYRTEDGRLQNRLIRLRDVTAEGKGILDKVLLDGIIGAANHDGGRVKFGADTKLYLTTGDAQKSELAQDLSSLNGKILRLNPDGTIPADNPFPSSPVYSYGHRNPQGLAWQPDTGRMYATEHGPSGIPGGRDELNYIEPGKNYGWPIITGDETRSGMVSPILQSGTSETWAPGGAAFVTQGYWFGSLLFVGLRGQSLYRITLDSTDPRKVLTFERLLTSRFGRLRDVAQSPDGVIYILTSNRDGRGQPQQGMIRFCD